jgi:IBR domain, a half RING-finger domain
MASLAIWMVEKPQQPQNIFHAALISVVQCFRLIYANHRSEISTTIGHLQCHCSFQCSICSLHLGLQDLDVEYHGACSCEEVEFCYICVNTFLEMQATDNQATRFTCLSEKRCELNKQMVRKRLSKSAIRILDQNEVLEGFNKVLSKHNRNDERLWHCPMPDCLYVGFVLSPDCNEACKVSCPLCLGVSCNACTTPWTRGDVQHTGLTCEQYLSSDAEFEQWKVLSFVQHCTDCMAPIEKNGGCAHMQCRCGFKFCWNCGQARSICKCR